MTRKDYELLAAGLRNALQFSKNGYHITGVMVAAVEIAKKLKEQNARFDEEKFYSAIKKV